MNINSQISVDTDMNALPARAHGLQGYLRRYRWLALVVGLPTLLASIYYGLIASDQYLSQSRFIVKSPGQHSGQVSTLASLIQTTGLSAGQEETNAIMDYIRSRNALSDLAKCTNIRAVYGQAGADWFSRYPAPMRSDNFENLFKFYGTKVSVHTDHETGLAVLDVRAFTPQDTLKLNTCLLSQSERLVNRLNQRAEQHAIAEAARRVSEAQNRVSAARRALGRFRNGQSLIDPEKQATGIFEIVTRLTEQRTQLQAQYDLMRSTAPGNPGMVSLRNRIAAVNAQIDQQTARVVGRDTAIASKVGGYEGLLQEQQFAAQVLTLANASAEQAQSEAEKQQFYLERVVEPTMPDKALYPERLWSVMTVFGASLCLYFIGWMLIVGILEHSPED